MAAQLDEWNRSRQQAETRVVEEALGALEEEELPRVVVAWSEGWHPGVVGIAAGRIARQLHRPVRWVETVQHLGTLHDSA